MGRPKRYFMDLESGDFVVGFDKKVSNHSRQDLAGDVDDQVSRLSDPTGGFSPSRRLTFSPDGRLRGGNPLKLPIAYIRKVASKKLSNIHGSKEFPNENSNLLKRFQQVAEEEQKEELIQLQSSQTFFLSVRKDAPDSPTSATFSSSDGYREDGPMSFSTNSRGSVYFAWCGLVLYIFFGSFTYSVILEPNWSLLDSLYFCITNLTTVGNGDVPTSQVSKVFTCLYIPIGCLWLFGMILVHFIKEYRQKQTKTDRLRQVKVLSALERKSRKEEPKISVDANYLLWFFLLASLGGLTFVLASLSGWSIMDVSYFMIHTFLFIGQSEISVETPLCKFIVILWIPIAFGTMIKILVKVSEYFASPTSWNCYQPQFDDEQLEEDLKGINIVSKTDTVTRAEFLELALISMHKMDRQLVQELRGKYDNLLESNIKSGTQLRTHLVNTFKSR